MARVTRHVVAIRANKIRHRDWIEHPTDAAALLDNSVWDLLRAILEKNDVFLAGELELVFWPLKALFRERRGSWAEAVLVPASVVECNVPGDIGHATSFPRDSRGRGFNTWLPRSPCLANLVVLYSAPLNIGWELPPAMPHGSLTGAKPGLRHG